LPIPIGRGIELALHQSGGLFAIELSDQMIELGLPRSEGGKCRSGRARRFVGFIGIVLIQTGQILGDPAVEMGCLLGDLSPPHNALGARRCSKLRAVECH
jgi:hypothetical protein